jgi:hypothetical protein
MLHHLNHVLQRAVLPRQPVDLDHRDTVKPPPVRCLPRFKSSSWTGGPTGRQTPAGAVL